MLFGRSTGDEVKMRFFKHELLDSVLWPENRHKATPQNVHTNRHAKSSSRFSEKRTGKYSCSRRFLVKIDG
jgi:hypothetical protein